MFVGRGMLAAFAACAACAAAAGEMYSGPISGWKPVSGGKVMRFEPPAAAYAAGGEIVMDVEIGWRNVVKDRPKYQWSGVMATGTAVDPEGRKVFVITRNLGDGTHGKDVWRFKGIVPEGSTNLTLEVGLKVARGEMDFGNVRVALNPCNPEKRIRAFKFQEWQKAPVDLDFVDWYGAPTNEPPRLGGRGFAFFRVDEPGFTFDRFAPAAAQLADSFRMRVTPGEVRDFFFGVYSERGSKGLAAEAGEFRADGFLGLFRRPLGAAPSISRVKNWPMCGDMGTKRTYTVMPDPILPWSAAGEDLPAGTTAMAMLQFAVPFDARAGLYAGEVVFTSADGERHAAKVEVEVLPFRLVRPRPEDYETVAHVGQYGGRRETFVKMAKEFKRRGIESLLIPTAYGNGRLKLRKGADGRLEIESFDRLRDAAAAYRAAGMTGTFFVHLSDKLEVAVAKALGVKVKDAIGEQVHMIPEFETESFKRHVGEALAAIKAECAGLPLAVLVMDEPNSTNRLPRARYEADRIRESGIKVALYGDMVAYDAIKPDYCISSDMPGTSRLSATLDDMSRRPGSRLYLYLGSGSYHYAFGSMYAGRFNHGWGDYLAGPVHGHTAWNFLAERPTDFSGIGHFAGWATLDHFDKDMNLRWTLSYEAICEGFLDRCYISTLEARLAERRGTPEAARVAAEFAALKAECASRGSYRDAVNHLGAPVPLSKPVFTNGDMDAVRSRIADLVMELE